MPHATEDTQSLTSFRRKSSTLLKQLHQNKRPVLLTIRGRGTAVIQDAEAYQRLLDIAAGADSKEGIRQGLEDSRSGRTRSVREFLAEFETIHGIRR